MMRLGKVAVVALAALAGACATGPGRAPVDVTRYHLGQPIARGTFVVEPLRSNETISPEFRTYADAVAAEMVRIGFTRTPGNSNSDFIVGVNFMRASRGVLAERSPVSIGLGGGSFGRGGGVGGGLSFGLGGREREVIVAELSVQIRRRSDNTTIWEGRAQTQAVENSPDFQPAATAAKLARALFQGFPGESGITITVP